MGIVDDFNKGNFFCVIGNYGITLFNQGSADQLPGTVDG